MKLKNLCLSHDFQLKIMDLATGTSLILYLIKGLKGSVQIYLFILKLKLNIKGKG